MEERAVKKLLPFVIMFALVAISCNRSKALSEINVDDDGLAIRGYDAVAYFTRHAAVRGSAEHSLRWKGAEWRFSSAEHLELFRKNPEKYAPQYGGY
jgi:YHS domain-containing protein